MSKKYFWFKVPRNRNLKRLSKIGTFLPCTYIAKIAVIYSRDNGYHIFHQQPLADASQNQTMGVVGRQWWLILAYDSVLH